MTGLAAASEERNAVFMRNAREAGDHAWQRSLAACLHPAVAYFTSHQGSDGDLNRQPRTDGKIGLRPITPATRA